LNYQNLANDIIGGTQAVFNSTIGNSFFNFGPTFPAINNRIYPWLDENGQWWIFDQGFWVYKNPVVAGSYERRIFVGTTNDLLSYDGGDGTAVAGDTSGPMWMVDTLLDARFPVGVGAFAASGAVAVLGTATSTSIVGEDQHTLSAPEIPSHTHSLGANGKPAVFWDNFVQEAGGDGNPSFSFNQSVPETSTSTGGVIGGGGAHNNLPPFCGVYFIKRTSRIYYTK
jgi:microcystin-dependent protein